MKVETELEGLLEALAHQMEEIALASRATSALLLADKMGLDLTEPVQAQKVMRHLTLVERYVGGRND